MLGKNICFEDYIDYGNVMSNPHVQRLSYLAIKEKVKLVKDRKLVNEQYPLIDSTNQ